MRTLLWIFFLAAMAVGAALLGKISDGYVLWVIPPWRVEISFNLYVLLQILVLGIAYLFLRTVFITLEMPRVVADYRARRARQRDEQHAIAALRQFWEGRYAQALKSAEQVKIAQKVGDGPSRADVPPVGGSEPGLRARGAEKVDDHGTGAKPPRSHTEAAGIAILVAMRCAHALRDERRIALWSAHADDLDEQWCTARVMAQMRIMIDARDFAAAQRVLESLDPRERRQISTQRLALRLAQGQGDWAELLRLARLLEKHHALTHDQALPLRLSAHRGMIEGWRDDPAQLMRHWDSLAADEKADPRLAIHAAQTLAAAGACQDCARLVEDYLASAWEPALLEAYAQCEEGDVLGRIAHCEQWLAEHPKDADLLLALGRLCQKQQLWGKAQSYLEAALAVARRCEAHIELARLLDRLERPEEANRHYRAAASCQAGTGGSPSGPSPHL